MSALGDYRRFSITISGFKATHEARVVLAGLDAFRLYADDAVAELEADCDGWEKIALDAAYALDKEMQKRKQAEAELAEIERGCCASCDSCTRVGFCLNKDARINVRTDYPMQSDFRCRYWTARVTK